ATSPPPAVSALRLELCPPGAGRCLELYSWRIPHNYSMLTRARGYIRLNRRNGAGMISHNRSSHTRSSEGGVNTYRRGDIVGGRWRGHGNRRLAADINEHAV